MPNFLVKLKELLDQLKNDKLKQNLLQALPFWIASLIAGLVAVAYARLFALAEEFSLGIAQRHGWALFLLMPACFLAAYLLVRRYARAARGSGIPQVMAALELAKPRHHHHIETLLGLRVVVVKVVSSLLMALGGGAVGREGPTIQISGGIFWKINQLLPKTWPRISKQNMILTGAAAGLAAAFNTPLGGIVFAIEELAKTHINYFKTAIFTAVLLAGLTAQGILGPYLYLGYPNVSGLAIHILLFVILVAGICGMLGALMSKIILKVLRWKASVRFRYFHIAYALLAALAMAAIAYFVSDSVLGTGKPAMSHMLFTADKYGGWQLPILRFVGPIISFTAGAAGGVFAPALTAGAAVGSLVSDLFSLAGPNANLLMLSGMVAFLTGLTRSPFTSAILVLEMTDRHGVIFHLLMAGLVAGLTATLVEKRSFYSHLEQQYLDEVQANN